METHKKQMHMLLLDAIFGLKTASVMCCIHVAMRNGFVIVSRMAMIKHALGGVSKREE